MPNFNITLTKQGHEAILRNGVYETFKKFSVTDDGNLYSVTETADLSIKANGGLRTLVTPAPTCEYATSKPISKVKPTTEEIKRSTEKLYWEIARLDDCATTYTATNAKILINLRTWFNYLNTKIGPTNYDYNDKLQLSLIDNIKGIEKVLNASTYEYDKIASYEDINMSYRMDTPESCDNYKNIQAYIMTIKDGRKTLTTSTKNRNWSPIILNADTMQNQNGFADKWKMSLSVLSHGYVALTKDSKQTTFSRNNFYKLSDIENMTQDQIVEKFKLLRPAVILSNNNSNSDLYTLTDLVGNYTEGVDMLPTYTQRYFNADGQPLITGLINKCVNFIRTSFTESTTTPGLFEQRIKMRIDNKKVSKKVYDEKSIVGGNIEFILQWDDNVLAQSSNYDDIVTWI
jgi:hypothetical protein